MTQPPEWVQHKMKIRRTRRAKDNRNLMTRIAALTGWVCHYCGIDVSASSGVAPTLDHVVPLSVSRDNTAANKVLACDFCNAAKGNKSLKEFLAWLNHIRTTAVQKLAA